MNANNVNFASKETPLTRRDFPVDRSPYLVCRSFPVRLLRSALIRARGLAPRWVYNILYRLGFAVWKAALRVLYRRKVLVAWLGGDREQFEMYRTVHRAMRYSLVGSSGLEATYKAVVELVQDDVEGCLVECGVAEGGCAALMASVVKHNGSRPTWLFDSFKGLPDPTEADFVELNRKVTGENIRPLERGSCLGTLEKVQGVLFRRFGLSPTRVHLVQGWFQDTLPVYRTKMGPIAMLRIDGDWYESTKCCLENMFDQLVPGGYCIADDYGTFYGCRKAVDEFIQSRNLKIQAVSDGRGGFLFRKPLLANPESIAIQSKSRC
jgi:O-methyltransferase